MASFFSSLFGRSEKTDNAEVTGVFPADSFSILEGEAEGKAVMGSVNKGYRNYSKKAEFPWCLHIGIALVPANLQANGLPKDEEIDVAYKQEDELVLEIKNIETAHFIGHVFNDGYLDIYLYLPDPAKVHEYLQTQINKKGLLRAFSYDISEDAEWYNVAAFME